MKKLLISTVAAATMLTTAGVADIATDGTGQFLVAPGFYAKGNYNATELKLVNTSLTHSVAYRGVIREFQTSKEIDFIILLSPSDVWNGEIYLNDDGAVYFRSDDDSNYDTVVLADPGINLKTTLAAGAGSFNRNFKKGYVEFYPIAAWREVTDGNIASVVTKSTLRTRFNSLASLTAAPTSVNYPVVGLQMVSNNLVAGYATMKNDNLKASMTIPMTAFEDVINAGTAAAQGFGTTPYIAWGPNIAPATDTIPVQYLTGAGVGQIATDITTTAATVPYTSHGVNDALYFTFWNDFNDPSETREDTAEAADNYQYCAQARSFQIEARDMEENRPGGTSSSISPAPASSPNTVRCEFNGVRVQSLLNLARATSTTDYAEGMVKIYNILGAGGTAMTREGTGANPAVIISNVAAIPVNGSYSYSWTYAPVER